MREFCFSILPSVLVTCARVRGSEAEWLTSKRGRAPTSGDGDHESRVLDSRLENLGGTEIKKKQHVCRTGRVVKRSETEKLGQDLCLGTAPAFEGTFGENMATSFEFCTF